MKMIDDVGERGDRGWKRKKEATKNYPHYVIAMFDENELSALYISAERYGLEWLELLDKVLDRLEATSGFYVH